MGIFLISLRKRTKGCLISEKRAFAHFGLTLCQFVMPNVEIELCEMGLIEFNFLISFCTNQVGNLGKLSDI